MKSSLVVEHLSARYQLSADTGMAFIYCNYKESRTTIAYMRIALKQLCRTMQSIPPTLRTVYEKHYSNDSQPLYDELRTVFLAIIQQFGRIFFVLDALDECTLDQRKDLCDFIFSVTNTASTSTSGIVKLFVASRKEPDIERAFRQRSIPTIEVAAAKVDNDIEVYVKAQIELRLQDERLVLRDMTLKDKILSALTTKAGGMYVFFSVKVQNRWARDKTLDISRLRRKFSRATDVEFEGGPCRSEQIESHKTDEYEEDFITIFSRRLVPKPSANEVNEWSVFN